MKSPSRTRKYFRAPGRCECRFIAGWKRMLNCWNTNAWSSRKSSCMGLFGSSRAREKEGRNEPSISCFDECSGSRDHGRVDGRCTNRRPGPIPGEDDTSEANTGSEDLDRATNT